MKDKRRNHRALRKIYQYYSICTGALEERERESAARDSRNSTRGEMSRSSPGQNDNTVHDENKS